MALGLATARAKQLGACTIFERSRIGGGAIVAAESDGQGKCAGAQPPHWPDTDAAKYTDPTDHRRSHGLKGIWQAEW